MTDQIPERSLVFLSTPYSKRQSLAFAHVEACTIAGKLMRSGLHVFCPIAHSHYICHFADIDRFDHAFWLNQNEQILRRCDVLVVAQIQGWAASIGIAHEIAHFEKAGKPIFDLDPTNNVMTKRKREKPIRDRYDGMPADEIAKNTNEYLQPDHPIPANSLETSQGQERPVEFLQGGELAGDSQ